MELKFKRGDTAIHFFKIPREIYQAGSTLYFMAKAEVDDDFDDSKAEISKSFNDSVVNVDETHATYTLKFLPEDTADVVFGDTDSKELKGEFEFRTAGGDVYSFPSDKKFIKVKVFSDIRRGGR